MSLFKKAIRQTLVATAAATVPLPALAVEISADCVSTILSSSKQYKFHIDTDDNGLTFINGDDTSLYVTNKKENNITTEYFRVTPTQIAWGQTFIIPQQRMIIKSDSTINRTTEQYSNVRSYLYTDNSRQGQSIIDQPTERGLCKRAARQERRF